MEVNIQQQIFDQLRKANKVLIALPAVLTADSLASGLALKMFLQKLQKDVDLASSGPIPENLKFLPGVNSIKSDVVGSKSLVVTVDTSKKMVDEISYQTAADKTQIYIKSQGEAFAPEDISFGADKFPVDAIVTLEASSLEDLGPLFEKHTDLFFETPKINIDNKAGNEYFGAINYVDVTASSVAELLTGLLEKFEAQLFDEDIATCLLTGIITKTNSFQHTHTTPQAFLKASQLISIGGRQQEIIKYIYKTKPLALLKLWGRALARIKTINESVVYSLLSASDFEKSEAGAPDVLPALKELMENVSGYKLLGLLCEQQAGKVRLVIACHLSINIDGILERLGVNLKPVQNAGQYQIFDFEVEATNLDEAERRFLAAVKPLPQTLATE